VDLVRDELDGHRITSLSTGESTRKQKNRA
jgi:hypothetical protein